MMEAKTVTQLDAADEGHAVSTIVLAFAADPGARWFSPDAARYLENMTSYARAVAATAVTHGSAYGTADRRGVALWLPPGVELDEAAVGDLLESGTSESVRAELEESSELVAEYRPSEPHWYLPVMAVDPAYQGGGLGGALLADACARLDREGAAAYLESSNQRNVPFYERHGFEALGVIEVGALPPIVPMLRTAREITAEPRIKRAL